MNRVIFIDDDHLFLSSLRRSLSHLKDRWKMHFFSRPAQALKAFGRSEDAVFVIDWLMPETDGLAFAAKLREAAAEQDTSVYIIMLTARQDRKEAVRALEQGVDDYLCKPVEPSELAARIGVGIRLLENERRSGEAKSLRLASAMKAFPDGVLITDLEGRIVDINDAGLRLYKIAKREQALGKKAIGFVARRDREKTFLQFGILMKKGAIGPFLCDLEVGRKKRSIPVELSAALVTGPDGAPEGFVGIARDISERKQSDDLRRRFVEQVMAAQDEERRIISRELHDETGQWISSLIAGLSALEDATPSRETKKRARELRHLSTMALSEIRRIAKGLHPSVLDSVGLPTALTRYANDFSKTHGIRVEVQVVGLTDAERLSSALETTLYRIAQETLTNSARHAQAATISVLLVRGPTALRLIIEDDGRGFSTDSLDDIFRNGRGLGLHGMRERAELFGGVLKIESAPGEGTTVAVEIPMGETKE